MVVWSCVINGRMYGIGACHEVHPVVERREGVGLRAALPPLVSPLCEHCISPPQDAL